MDGKEMDKHMRFLHKYALDNNILFRVSRRGITVEDVSPKAEAIKKGSK